MTSLILVTTGLKRSTWSTPTTRSSGITFRRRSHSAAVRQGGFSMRVCTPAVMAFFAMLKRWGVGTEIETHSDLLRSSSIERQTSAPVAAAAFSAASVLMS